MNLHGLHHVTSISGKIGQNAAFYTRVLGLRLVKKSVNQDDVRAYHLFYADKLGTPGTDITFFDWAHIPTEQRGTDSITLTAFRVNGEAAIQYWAERLQAHGITHHGVERFKGRAALRFEDQEGQRLMLLDDGGIPFEGEVWDQTDVPAEYALRGFYASMISVPDLTNPEILTVLLNFTEIERVPYPDGREVIVFAITGDGGAGRELWVMVEPDAPIAQSGAGGTHHIAFRVSNEDELRAWHQRVRSAGVPASSVIDRYYFKSVYFRISQGILFEIATDDPGFATDESLETLGERLALPPFLEPRRESIEANLKPIIMD